MDILVFFLEFQYQKNEDEDGTIVPIIFFLTMVFEIFIFNNFFYY